jgi:hypothetical protein
MAVLLRSWRDEKEKKRLKRKTLRGLKVLKSKVEGRKTKRKKVGRDRRARPLVRRMAVLLRSWRDEKEKKRLKRKTLRGRRSGE